jgi:GNAT superfamily N-acetyltransferase
MGEAKAERLEPIPVTVTFLAMEKPPAHYPAAPMNRQVALLRANDIPLHYYRYLMDRVGRKWHWVNALREDDEALETALHAPGRDIRVLYLDGAPAGFFDIRPHLPLSAELGYFGLTDRAMGTGLGRWFLGAAIQTAWALGPRRVTVQTCTLDHPAALPLYQKLGFAPVGQSQEVVQPMPLKERAEILVR